MGRSVLFAQKHSVRPHELNTTVAVHLSAVPRQRDRQRPSWETCCGDMRWRTLKAEQEEEEEEEQEE